MGTWGQQYVTAERVVVTERFMQGDHVVLIMGRTPEGRRAWYDGQNWQAIDENAAAPEQPGFVMPLGALEKLVAEALRVLPPNDQQERHLSDAVDVRDRLLTLVEKVVNDA